MPKQLDFEFKTREERTIDFIRKYKPKDQPYFLGFSGGKDSIVMYDLVKKAGVEVISYYSATGIDPPEIVKFIKKHYPDVIHKRPNHNGTKSFFGMIQIFGAPTIFSRWCCSALKKWPVAIRKVPLRHRLLGIRREESSKRAKKPNPEKVRKMNIWMYYPIFEWLEWEIWDYIEENNLSYCLLYDEGFSRIGCVVCPFLCSKNQSELNRNKKRWPKHYVAFEKAMKKLWDTREKKRQLEKGYSKNFDEFLDKWYRGEI